MQFFIRPRFLARRAAAAALQALALACGLAALPALANNVGEDDAWNFQSGAARTMRATSLDMLEKQRAGYYNSVQMIVTNTTNTYIQRQVNCSLAATTTGNSGTNGMNAYASSPSVSNANSVGASTSANGASNYALPGTSSGSGGLNNTQSNSGSLNSGVSGSSSSGSTGAISAGGGTASQALNTQQTSSGELSASVQGSTACAGVAY
jgi:hypothetical protein